MIEESLQKLWNLGLRESPRGRLGFRLAEEGGVAEHLRDLPMSASLQLPGSRKQSSRAQDWLRKATASGRSQGHTGGRQQGSGGSPPGGKLQLMVSHVDVLRK